MARATQQRSAKRPRRSSSGSGSGYNADAEQAKRTAKVHTVVGQEFHRRVMDHEVTREARDLEVAQQRVNARIAAKEREIYEQEDSTDEQLDAIRDMSLEDKEAIEDEIIELSDDSMVKTYELLALLLVDKEGKPPPLELLKKMDSPDVAPLVKELIGGEPVEGPTRTSSS